MIGGSVVHQLVLLRLLFSELSLDVIFKILREGTTRWVSWITGRGKKMDYGRDQLASQPNATSAAQPVSQSVREAVLNYWRVLLISSPKTSDCVPLRTMGSFHSFTLLTSAYCVATGQTIARGHVTNEARLGGVPENRLGGDPNVSTWQMALPTNTVQLASRFFLWAPLTTRDHGNFFQPIVLLKLPAYLSF